MREVTKGNLMVESRWKTIERAKDSKALNLWGRKNGSESLVVVRLPKSVARQVCMVLRFPSCGALWLSSGKANNRVATLREVRELLKLR